MELGVGFSSEELAPNEIVRAAVLAEEAGFMTAWVSDHFHPWIDAQGESPFVWSVLGGIAHATEPDQEGFLRFYEREVLPEFAKRGQRRSA